jgi:hypothetical protein
MERKISIRKTRLREPRFLKSLSSENLQVLGSVINFTSDRHNISGICSVAADCKIVVAMSLVLSAKIIEYLGFSAKHDVFFANFGVMDGVGKLCSSDYLDHDINNGLQRSTTTRNS